MLNEGNEAVEGQDPQKGATPATTPQTPTAEEQLKTLQAQLAEKERILSEREESYKGLQRRINEKDTELKKQAELRTEIDAINERLELLATAIASGTQAEEIEAQPEKGKPKITETLDQLRQRQAAKKQQQEALAKGEEYRSKVEALGLTAKDKRYFAIRNAVRSGDFDEADFLISEVEEEKAKVIQPKAPEPKKETDEEIFLRIARQKGLLKSEPVVPAGGGQDEWQVRKDYASGKIDAAERAKRLRAIGIDPTI